VFAALLGFNPVQHLLGHSGVLATLPKHNVAVLTGNQFFPHLISAPFHHGLIIVFTAAALMSATGAVVSLLRGGQFYYEDAPVSAGPPAPAAAGSREGADGAPVHPAPNGQAPPAGSHAPPLALGLWPRDGGTGPQASGGLRGVAPPGRRGTGVT
jgi:hypothetical protein